MVGWKEERKKEERRDRSKEGAGRREGIREEGKIWGWLLKSMCYVS